MEMSKLEEALKDHVGYAASRNAANIMIALEKQLEAGGENEMPVSVHFRVKKEMDEVTLAIDDVSWKITKKVVDRDFYSIPVESAQLELPFEEAKKEKQLDLVLPVYAVPARGSLPVNLDDIQEAVALSKKNMYSFLDEEEIALVYIADGKWFARRPRNGWVRVHIPLTAETLNTAMGALESAVIIGSGSNAGIWNGSSRAFRSMSMWIAKEGFNLYLKCHGSEIQYDDAGAMARDLKADLADRFLVNPEVVEACIGYKDDNG